MRRLAIALALLPTAALAADPRCTAEVGALPPGRDVLDSAGAATGVGRAYLTARYGADLVRAQEPLHATLADGVWSVDGTLPAGTLGGTARIALCRHNGAVLSVFRTQ